MYNYLKSKVPALLLLAALSQLAVASAPPVCRRRGETARVAGRRRSPARASGLVKGSHVKVFLPSLPYLYTSHSINGALAQTL